jgi:hypothetical protein
MLGDRWASHALKAASEAVTASDTISRNPIATTRPNERRRSTTKPRRSHAGWASRARIVFSACLEFEEGAVAATMNVIPPRTEASIPARR